jgi:hypothetical protein
MTKLFKGGDSLFLLRRDITYNTPSEQRQVTSITGGRDINSTKPHKLNPLTPEFLLNNIHKFSSQLTGNNTLRPRYKDQPINAV